MHQQQPSIRSTATSTTRSMSTVGIDLEEEFPLPGGLPLLPPQRSDLRQSSSNIADSSQKRRSKAPAQPISQPKVEIKQQEQNGHSPSTSEEPLYVLQPRTYTPQPPEPSPSPRLKPAVDSPKARKPTPLQTNALGINSSGMQQGNASIRNRVSQKTTPPEAIQIPPRSVPGPSPVAATPRTTHSNPFDSAYGSDSESVTQPALSQVGSEYGISPPSRPQVTHSPRSDQQQYYRPVRASPHSPLQQRPHTAAGPRASSHMHLRNQPSALGGMSTLSNVTNAVYDDDTKTQASGARTTGATLRKKKSAFGWFKKAFSLDEDEKAAFEARKAMQHRDRYYDPNSPKFLDGRRIR